MIDIPATFSQLPSVVTVDYMPISLDGSTPRHSAERAGAIRLIHFHFGQNTVLSHDAAGAPFLVGLSQQISISHCTGMVALAIHPTLRIGIDVERPRQQLIKVQHKYLNNNEMTMLHNIEELLWAWTAKEAVYKAAGIPGLELASIALQLPVHGNASAEISDGHGALRKFALYSRFHNDIMTTIAIPQ